MEQLLGILARREPLGRTAGHSMLLGTQPYGKQRRTLVSYPRRATHVIGGTLDSLVVI